MIQPPTSRLPPIAKIAAFSSAQLFESLQYLYSLYRPQVRGSRRRRRDRDENALRPSDDDAQRVLESDAFERAYAIRWLTALIVQLEARQKQSTPTGTQPPSSPSNLPIDDDTLIQQTASLLAICAGVAAAPKLHRRFSFESPVPACIDLDKTASRAVQEVHIDLTDIPLDNQDYASVGAQTWGGACVLAEMIAERPDRFGLGCVTGTRSDPLSAYSDRPLRVLELGAGTGLVGLTVAKLLQASPPCKDCPRATIVLTDFYPAVLANLQFNIDANFPTLPDKDNTDRHAAIVVHSHPLDWSSFSSTTGTLPLPDMLSTPFDLVFGADIVYEARHAIWIRDCLTSLLLYPNGSDEDPIFHLIIPLRPTHTFESSTVEEVFGSKDCASEGSLRDLTVLSKESIFCEAYRDEGSKRSHTDDDVEYVYYRIGWTR